MWSRWALLPLLAAPSLAQQILQFGPGQLPQCAQSCQLLTNAQTACISVPTTEHSCFCQSAYLTQQTNLYQTDSGVCTDTCPQDSDRQQIQNWFKGYCADPNAAAPPPSDNNGAGAPPASSTAASAPATTTSSFAGTPVGENEGSWWSQHARWIAMVIVLVVAFILITVLGIWFKKRHDRKVNRATSTPLPAGWGPNSDPHQYSSPAEKTSTSRVLEPAQTVAGMEEGRTKSQRLSKRYSKR